MTAQLPQPPPAQVLADADVERALVVSAHPDDVDFGAAGTVATWTDAGIEVVYCVCTDGQAGGFQADTPRDQMPAIRRAEQQRAAEVVGVRDVRVLGRVDGELQVTSELVRDIVAVIRDVRPQRMLIQSSERDWLRIYRSHPDHLAAGEAAIRAIYPAARNAFAFPELLTRGLQPWTVLETWLAAHPVSNHPVDVAKAFDRKVEAILAHRSQHPQPERIEPIMRAALASNAASFGLPEGALAESFFVIPTG